MLFLVGVDSAIVMDLADRFPGQDVIGHLEDGASLSSLVVPDHTTLVVDLDVLELGVYTPADVRKQWPNLIIIGLSGDRETLTFSQARTTFLDSGGDDYLPNPVSPSELRATIAARLRSRNGNVTTFASMMYKGHLIEWHTEYFIVRIDGVPMEWTGSERKFFIEVASYTTQRTKEQILRAMYQSETDTPEMKIIDVYACKVRKRLENVDPALKSLIVTLWGSGYRLDR